MITPSQAAEADRVSLAIEEGEPIEPATVTGTPPVDNPILDALDDLSGRYPEDTVSIFANKDGSSGKVAFCGYILYRNRDFDSVMGDRCDTPAEAVEKVTLKAGGRTKAARIAKRLAELQQEMERLNAEAKEVA